MKWIFFLFFSGFLFAQNLQLINQEQQDISFRGLSVVDSNTIWIAGSKGIVGQSLDGGKSFTWKKLKQYKENEFRDIQAFEEDQIIIMAITHPAEILEATRTRKKWKSTFTDKNEKAFLNAIDCLSFERCIGVGDAIEPNQFYFIKKINSRWELIALPFKTKEGEAYFAASGGNVQMLDDESFIAVSGGKSSRVFYQYKGIQGVQDLEIIQGKETTGANAVYFNAAQNLGMAVGGDFNDKSNSMFNLVLFSWNESDQKFDFSMPISPPLGYKSSISQLSENLWVCCGTSGIDYSRDAGKTWIHFSDEAFHVVQKRSLGSAYLAGPEGKIALFTINP